MGLERREGVRNEVTGGGEGQVRTKGRRREGVWKDERAENEGRCN